MTTENKDYQPLIVGIGGTTRDGSSSERALRISLDAAEALGARTKIFSGSDLILPMYDPAVLERSLNASELVAALRACDGVIITSPGYHGSISGMVKNALDYTEDMNKDPRVYFDGRAVGCIACAYGWQATGSTLNTLRSIAHALRGWPTPMGVAINSAESGFGEDGLCTDEKVNEMLRLLAKQVYDFAMMSNLARQQGAA